MTRALVIFVVVLLLLVGGALVAPGFVDWNKYKGPIISQIETATGYEVSIGGDLDMAVLPFPRVLINDLGIGVPGEAEKLVTLKTASVNVALMPLLKKQLQINSVELKNPDVRLAVNEQGQPLWMTTILKERIESGRNAPAIAKDEDGLALSIDNVRITGGNFIFTDRRTNKPVKMTDIDMNVAVGSLSGPFSLSGSLRYANALMKIDAKSARLDSGAANAPLNAAINFPEAGSSVTFAGVAGLKDGQFELQGETGFKSSNLAQLMLALTGQINPALAKAVEAQGVVTFAGDVLAARNMKLLVGGQEMSATLEVAGLKQKPMNVAMTVEAAKPIDLKAVLPVAASETTAGTAKTVAKKPLQAFIPASLNLPVDINGKLDVKMAAVKFDKMTAQNIVANFVKTNEVVNWVIAADAFGGKIAEKGGLKYESASRTANGGVTYSEPQMKIGTQLQNIDLEDSLSPFLSAEQLKPLAPVLAEKISGTFDATITPQMIVAQPAKLSMGRDVMTYSLSYKLAARPLLTLALGADSFDAGRWLQPKQQAGQQAVSQPAAANKAQIADIAKKIALPLDLHLTLALKDVAMRGAKYDEVFFVGKMVGDRLDVEKAGLRDSEQNNVSIAGTVGSINNLRDIDMTIGATTPDALKMLSSFNVDVTKLPKNIGRAELASEFKGQADNLSFVVNLKAMQGTLESSGGLTNLLATPKINGLNLRLRHPSYVEVMRIFNPTFSSGVALRKSLDVFASMNRTDKLYKFTELQAQIGDIKASGNLDINTAGTRPSVKGALQLGRLPIDELLGVQKVQKGTVRATTTVPAATTGDVRWSRNALNTAWMWKFDADMAVTAAAVSHGEWVVENADLAIGLKDGNLSVSRLNGKIGGGSMALTAGMKSTGKDRQPVAMNATAKFADVELEQLVRGFSGAKLLKARGGVSMDLNVSSTGISPAALIFDLKGTGKAQGKNIIIEGFDLARLSRTLAAPSSSGTENITNIVNATMAGGSTQFENFYSDIVITEGVVTFPKFKMEGQDAALLLDGNVNLPLWNVDLTTIIKLTEPADAPELRLAFKGPLDNPGQTFGKGAMDSYVQQMIGSRVQDVISDKLEGVMDGKLNQLLGGGTTRTKAAPLAPTPAPAATPEAIPAPAPAPVATPPVESPAPTAAPAVQEAPAAQATPVEPATLPAEEPTPIAPQPTPEPQSLPVEAAPLPIEQTTPAIAPEAVAAEPAPVAEPEPAALPAPAEVAPLLEAAE